MESDLAPYTLIVDDDALLRTDIVELLDNVGFRTLEAANSGEAIELLKQHHADIALLFTDVQMPGKNGFVLAQETARSWTHIAIVVVSGDVKPAPGELPEGAHFIAKPFSAETVHGHLQEILPDGQKPAPLKRMSEAN
ncbi:response regulator [Lichenifustis flavocetrariae]|uniref:Response regulator n=1 Tax=Lichenifustis flavocetrariae TaxID=2949735 RepID=A0AA41Z1C6_9HYPH|nr:response regulator [Lichenifustis flavocetrariae]MCW6512426.1 response regulator [Lichenifustis flavocetrariae]